MSGDLSTGELKPKGILTDVTRCIGCRRCVEACVHANKLGDDPPNKTQRGDGLSGHRFTSIVPVGKSGKFVRKQCNHCLEPSCLSACLVGAFEKRPDGAVYYDAHKCIGCRYCMLACPFSIPRYNWDSPAPYIQKCRMDERCRVASGLPACVAACPAGATVFGEREALIAEANRRIAEGNKDPQNPRYLNHIYGEKEFGGTSVMYLTSPDAPLDILGFPTEETIRERSLPNLIEESIPHMNHGWVLVTPFWFFTVFSGLWVTWMIRRRQKLDGHDEPGHGAPPGGGAGIDEVCPLPQGPAGKEGK
jgi:formate dehydrogenase iron-sulfur subunit